MPAVATEQQYMSLGPESNTQQAIGWARVRPPGGFMLRRGAWYPVVIDQQYHLVVLGVNEKSVAVPRDRLRIRHHLPDQFSVVRRDPGDFNPVRGTTADLGPTYAVCPSSRSRVKIDGHPIMLRCPECGYEEEVAWEEAC